MKKTSLIFYILAVGVIIGAALLLPSAIEKNSNQKQVSNSSQDVGGKVSLAIDYSNGSSTNFSTDFKKNITASDLLFEAAKKMSFLIKTKAYNIGILIQGINGVEGGTNGKYWLYYVNGQLANVAADKDYLKPGDKVEFKFEKPSF